MIDLLRIPGVKPEMLLPEFWLSHFPEPDTPLLSLDEIEAFNRQVYAKLDLPHVNTVPEQLSTEDVFAHIDHYEQPTSPRYHADGSLVDTQYFEQIIDNARPDMSGNVDVQYGLTVRSTRLRAFPSDDLVTSARFEIKTDAFQETTLDVGTPVAKLAVSRDEQWGFCITPMYMGWLRLEDAAFGGRDIVLDYTQSESWVICRVSRGLVGLERGGGITPQMSTRLPLIEETDSLYRVRIPQKDSVGALCFVAGYIPKADKHFQYGYSPFSVRNLLESAFSMLGERYAWGGSRLGIFGRDCSRFVQDCYALCGLHLPRNSSQQGRIGQTILTFSPESSTETRKTQIIETATPGDLMFLPGHVVMYIGYMDREPYAIHARGGEYMRVLVSTLDLGNMLTRMTHIVTVH